MNAAFMAVQKKLGKVEHTREQKEERKWDPEFWQGLYLNPPHDVVEPFASGLVLFLAKK